MSIRRTTVPGRRRAAIRLLAATALIPAVLVATACAEDESPAAPTTTFPGESPLDRPGGHAASVRVTYTIEGDGSGSVPGQDQLAELEDRLTDALEPRGLGELGADEFGPGTVTVVVRGPDLDALWAKAEPILRSYPARPAHAELRRRPGASPRRIDL